MQTGDLIHERYRLEETLGSGGMAEVWRATDERLKRSVAIKFPAANLVDDPEFMVRFFAEAQAVARLSHVNVVKVLDFGEHEDHSYLVMEHVSGGSLKDIIDGPIDVTRARALIRQAALAAGAAHTEGIVHRDIKPGNILVDEQGHVKLADFGIASTAVSERLTATGAAIGSPHYVSPEQASGGTAMPQSDVYALGVVLYELLTGVRPIDADNIAAIAIAQVERDPAPPSTHVEGIDAETEAIVMRCLQKDPQARFADGCELAAALEEPETASAPLATLPVAEEVAADEDAAVSQAAGDGRGLWLVAGAAALVLVAAGIAFAMTRSTDEADARSPVPIATEDKSDKPKRRSPSPTVTDVVTEEPEGVPSSAPSETPAEGDETSDEGDEDDSEERRTRRPPPRPRPSKPPRTQPTPPPPSPASSPTA